VKEVCGIIETLTVIRFWYIENGMWCFDHSELEVLPYIFKSKLNLPEKGLKD